MSERLTVEELEALKAKARKVNREVEVAMKSHGYPPAGHCPASMQVAMVLDILTEALFSGSWDYVAQGLTLLESFRARVVAIEDQVNEQRKGEA